ncbi:MAG: hypothetical protein P4L46_00660 [Fimbriimonas sp.]|nr:hypothetical protein [Fimbriimonas sp.]
MDTLISVTSDPVARYLTQRGAKYDRKNRMRPMSTGEMLDTALRIYQRLGLTFLRMTVPAALLCLAAVGFVQNYVAPDLFTTQGSGSGADVIGEVAAALAMAVFMGGPLLLLGWSYSSSLIVHLVSDYLLGNNPDPDAASQTARAVLPRLFVVNLKELVLSVSGIVVSTLIMGVGGVIAKTSPDTDATAGVVTAIGVLAILPGIFAFLYFAAHDALAAPVAVIEGARSREASKRSRALLKRSGYHLGGTGTIWALYLLLTVIALVLEWGIYAFVLLLGIRDHLAALLSFLPGEALFLQAFDLAPSFLVIWTLVPVWASVVTIVYYERRVRLEGFDIDVLASEITDENR